MKNLFPVIVLSAFVLAACGKKEEPASEKVEPVKKIFEFQVIKSPSTGKCYEVVNYYYDHRLHNIFEVPCESTPPLTTKE